jgi:hypothetical protein
MQVKEVLKDITDYLKTKYAKEGVAFGSQENGRRIFTVTFAFKEKDTLKMFKIMLSELLK